MEREQLRVAILMGAISIGGAACETLTPEQKARRASPDNVNAVRAGDVCLGITTYGVSPSKSGVLVIYLHGDVSVAVPAGYMHHHASNPRDGAVSVVMLRPGYYDRHGKRSTGSSKGIWRYHLSRGFRGPEKPRPRTNPHCS